MGSRVTGLGTRGEHTLKRCRHRLDGIYRIDDLSQQQCKDLFKRFIGAYGYEGLVRMHNVGRKTAAELFKWSRLEMPERKPVKYTERHITACIVSLQRAGYEITKDGRPVSI